METTSTICERTVGIAQELTLLNLDTAEGYRAAAEHGDDSVVKQHCRDQARARMHAAHQLQSIVAAAGEQPVTSGSVGASMRRWWLELRSLIGSGDADALILGEAIRGEESAIQRYWSAIGEVPEKNVADQLAAQLRALESSLERLRTLKHEVAMA